MATLPAKAVQRYGAVLVQSGAYSGFLAQITRYFPAFAYLCGMATLQVGSVAAKAAWCSVPVCGRRKMKRQTPQTPVGHE
jgi:uncharacterized membrane protein